MISGLGEVVAGLVPKRFAHTKEEEAHPNSGRKYHCKVGNVREFRLFVFRSELDVPIAPRQPDDEEGKDWVRGCAMWFVGVEVEIFDSIQFVRYKQKEEEKRGGERDVHSNTDMYYMHLQMKNHVKYWMTTSNQSLISA